MEWSIPDIVLLDTEAHGCHRWPVQRCEVSFEPDDEDTASSSRKSRNKYRFAVY